MSGTSPSPSLLMLGRRCVDAAWWTAGGATASQILEDRECMDEMVDT